MKYFLTYCFLILILLWGCTDSVTVEKKHTLKFSSKVDSLLHDTISVGSVVDSLRNKLKVASNDTVAINLLNELAYYWKGEPIKIFSDEAYKLSVAKKYSYGRIDALSKKGYYLYWVYLEDSARFYYEKALHQADSAGIKKLQAQILHFTGDVHRVHFEYAKANKYYRKAVSIAGLVKDEKRLSLLYAVIADVNRLQSQFDSASFYYNKSLVLARKVGDLKSQAFCLAYMGDLSRLQGKHVVALNEFKQALQLAFKVKDRNLQAFCYSGSGDLYVGLFEKDSALANFEKALAISRAVNDMGSIISNLHSLGDIYYNKADWKKALAYLHEELTLARSINEKISTANALLRLGDYYREVKKDLDSAKIFDDEAFTISKEINYRHGQLKNLMTKTYTAFDTKNYKQAKKLGEESLVLSKIVKNTNYTIEVCRLLISIYVKENDFKKAYYLKTYREHLRDSVLNLEQIKKFSTTEYKFVEKNLVMLHKQKEALNKAQQAKKDEEIKRQQFVRNAFIIGFIIIALFSVLLFRSLKQNKRQKAFIQHQKEIVEEKQKEVMDSIRYAQRIQKALLPSHKYIERVFKKLKSKE